MGVRISYSPERQRFIATLDVEGSKRELESSTEKGIRKAIEKELKMPPIKAIYFRSYGATEPSVVNVVRTGRYLYLLAEDGRKRRVSDYDLRKFDEGIYEELCKIARQIDKLEGDYATVKCKLKEFEAGEK